MRAVAGKASCCLYIRKTSLAARLTNRSTCSRSRISPRHSLKKCPEPVSAHPQRGVLTWAIAGRPISFAEHAGKPRFDRRAQQFGRARVIRGADEDRLRARGVQILREQRIDDLPCREIGNLRAIAKRRAMF